MRGIDCGPWSGVRSSWRERRDRSLPGPGDVVLGSSVLAGGVHTKGYMHIGWEMMVWRPQERMN